VNDLSKLKCCEVFRGGNVAFQRDGRFYFGPIAELSALFSGDSDSFLVDDAAEEKVADLHAHHDQHRQSKPHPTKVYQVLIHGRWLTVGADVYQLTD